LKPGFLISSMDDEKPFHNPFDALRALRDRLPAAPDPPEPAAPPEAPRGATAAKTIPRAVVRMERSGRGGKEVTVIEQLGLTPQEREVWLKALKASLGCGGVVEGESLMLQGDQRTRVPKLLTARGVRRITVA
jgi:translation initiation factor 1